MMREASNNPSQVILTRYYYTTLMPKAFSENRRPKKELTDIAGAKE